MKFKIMEGNDMALFQSEQQAIESGKEKVKKERQ